MTNEREQLYKYKGNLCALCGLSVQEMVDRYKTFNRMFNFHHIEPSSKDKQYKKLMSQRLSRRQMEEVDKCVLLCTQCHNIIHAQEITAKLELSVDFNNRIIIQQFNGWVRADSTDKTLTFVTNQPYLLHLCEVRIGDREPILMFLVEIERDDNLLQWLRDIAEIKTISISMLYNTRLFMKINHITDNKINVEQSIGFPVTCVEFHPNSDPKKAIYFKNGYILTSSGDFHNSGKISYECDLHKF